MKYTAEEVRVRFEAWLIREHEYAPEDLIWQEKRNCYADYATHLAWNAYRDAYADLLERIRADEGAVVVAHRFLGPDGTPVTEWDDGLPDNRKTFPDLCPPVASVQYAYDRPPAQAAQVEDEDMDAQLTVMIEHLTSLVESQAAEPVAQPVDIGAIRKVIEVRDWLLARAKDGQMQRSVYTSNYQLREMAEAINVFCRQARSRAAGEG